jgi:hypothetical protein
MYNTMPIGRGSVQDRKLKKLIESWMDNISEDSQAKGKIGKIKMEFKEWTKNHNPTMESLTNEWLYGRDGYQTGLMTYEALYACAGVLWHINHVLRRVC